jgi:protein SCO1/2
MSQRRFRGATVWAQGASPFLGATVWAQGVSPFLLLCLVTALSTQWVLAPAWAHHNSPDEPPLLRQVNLEQRLHERLPLDLTLHDETGTPVRLGDYFGNTPVLLTLAYYNCPNLCPLVLGGLVSALRALPFTAGKEFQVLTVSIDARDTPARAAAAKAQYLQRYGRPQAATGWHFLTGEPEAIQRLAEAVGFRYTYDAANDQFAHASGLMLLTPQGVLSRYFYGVEYAPRDLRLGLVEAADNRIGSPIDQLLLYCYHYDPQTGKYSVLVMNVLRLAGLTTAGTLGVVVGLLLYRERTRGQRHVV